MLVGRAMANVSTSSVNVHSADTTVATVVSKCRLSRETTLFTSSMYTLSQNTVGYELEHKSVGVAGIYALLGRETQQDYRSTVVSKIEDGQSKDRARLVKHLTTLCLDSGLLEDAQAARAGHQTVETRSSLCQFLHN
jgi:hypothetical protein